MVYALASMKNFYTLFILFFFNSLGAIEGNHYMLGTNGINSAVKPEKAFIYTNMFNHYKAHDLKNRHGKNLPVDGTFNQHFDLNIFSWFPGVEWFCGTYGTQLIIPFLDSTAEFTFVDLTLRGGSKNMKLADIYFEPFDLTWRFDCFNLFVSYGFYAPSGRFKPFSLKNSGLGNWGHQLAVAGTYFFDQAKTFTASAYVAYEFHCKKRNIDIYPGQNLTIDWGIGKTFMKFLTIGVVGYAEWQTTFDHGKDVPNVLRGLKDRVFSIGPEVNALIPFINGQAIIRYEREFDARARTQGTTFIAALAILF